LNRFASFFIIFLLGCPVFSSNESILIGDVTKEELFLTNPNFYESYLASRPIDLEEKINLNGLSIKILFGTWCHDSQREIPKFLRFLENINMNSEMISLIGLNYQKNEPLNRGNIFNIKNTPTIIFFRNEEEIGRIEETPKLFIPGVGQIAVTLEENILFILKNN
jgi:thiol-disulfide isomerase/thioredoxin